MADYQLRARIPQELADKLFKVMKEVQEETKVADVTTSSITRAAIEQYVKNHEEDKKQETLIIKFPNNMTDDELKRFSDTMSLISQQVSNEDSKLKKAYTSIEMVALRENIRRKNEDIQKKEDHIGLWIESKTEEEIEEMVKKHPKLQSMLEKWENEEKNN